MNLYIKKISDCEYTLKDKIIDILWYNPPMICCRRVGRFILRLFRWIPVLWKQEEWDFGYTYDLLEQKIKDLRACIKTDDRHTSECIQEELEQIDSVLDHLDKYRNWTDYIEIPEPPEDFQRFTDTEDELKQMHFTEEEHEAYQRAHEFEEEHFNAFWDELKNHGGNWWT